MDLEHAMPAVSHVSCLLDSLAMLSRLSCIIQTNMNTTGAGLLASIPHEPLPMRPFLSINSTFDGKDKNKRTRDIRSSIATDLNFHSESASRHGSKNIDSETPANAGDSPLCGPMPRYDNKGMMARRETDEDRSPMIDLMTKRNVRGTRVDSV